MWIQLAEPKIPWKKVSEYITDNGGSAAESLIEQIRARALAAAEDTMEDGQRAHRRRLKLLPIWQCDLQKKSGMEYEIHDLV